MGRPLARTSLAPCPPSPLSPAAVHARPNRIDTALSVSFRLMDRAARSPFHCGMGHVGLRARAPMLRDGLRLPCSAPLAHCPLLDSNRWVRKQRCALGGVLALLSILLYYYHYYDSYYYLHQPRRVSHATLQNACNTHYHASTAQHARPHGTHTHTKAERTAHDTEKYDTPRTQTRKDGRVVSP